MDKISIIVPVYNIAKYIEKTVLSIQMQTYENIEIILIDDGSADESGMILDRIAEEDNRVRVFHQDNRGVTSARFTGIQAATGEWIGFVDGDDYIEPNMYERLLGNAQHYQADISHCGFQRVTPSRIDYYYNTGCLIKQDTQSGLKDLLEGKIIEPSLCNKLFRRRLFDRVFREDLIDFSIKNNEDLLLNFYLFQASAVSIYEDFCPYHYIARKGSAANAISESRLRDPLRVLRIINVELGDKSNSLSTIVMSRYVNVLIGQATREVSKESPAFVRQYKKRAQGELRQCLKDVLFGKYSRKLKIQILWTAVWPWSYGAVHRIYTKVSGLDKKYNVE